MILITKTLDKLAYPSFDIDTNKGKIDISLFWITHLIARRIENNADFKLFQRHVEALKQG